MPWHKLGHRVLAGEQDCQVVQGKCLLTYILTYLLTGRSLKSASGVRTYAHGNGLKVGLTVKANRVVRCSSELLAQGMLMQCFGVVGRSHSCVISESILMVDSHLGRVYPRLNRRK